MSPISPLSYEKLLKDALHFAQLGGDCLKHYWSVPPEIEEKFGFSNLVTQADKASEEVILAALKKIYPDHLILAEESGQQGDPASPYTWVIDPLDGTTNYAHKYPTVAVSIGILYRGEPIVGVVLNPILNETFYAATGLGAFCNSQRMHVSTVNTLARSLLVSGFPYDRRGSRENNYPEFSLFTHLSQGVRRDGAAALDLAYVAAGRFEGYWERGVQPWDIAAGIVLVREAGGRVTGYDGEPVDIHQSQLLATNGHVHEAMSRELMRLKAMRHLSGSELTLAAILEE